MLDLGAGQGSAVQVAAHDQPIRCVRFIDAPGSAAQMLVTGSWDKTVKYWDLRQSTAVATLPCQERVYSLDVKDKLMVIATADRYINIINLADPTKIYKTMQSVLKWQTRVVSCFPDASGFAIGSIEGRCAIQYVEDKDSGYGGLILVRARYCKASLTKTRNAVTISLLNATEKRRQPSGIFLMSTR